MRPGGMAPGMKLDQRMKRKDYDDDVLVDLIARGDVSYSQIARRVGTTKSTVGAIACGKLRPELQARIDARTRKYLADRRRPGGMRGEEPGSGRRSVRSAFRRKDYDDDLLVDLIAKGELPYHEIARIVGLSPSSVAQMARGERRRSLRTRIGAAVKGMREEAHRLAARWLKGLLTRHIRNGIEGKGEFARRCRKDLIDKLFDPDLLREIESDSGGGGLPTPGLTDEDYEAIAKLKGAPPDDDEDTTEGQT